MPVFPGIVPRCCAAARLLSHHIVAKGDIRSGRGAAIPRGGEVIHHDLEALNIEQQQIEVHVQSIVVVVDIGDQQLKQRPLFGRQHPLVKRAAGVGQGALLCSGAERANIKVFE